MIDPHGKTIAFGKHKGELFTRLPRSYLVWMINQEAPQWEIAKAEFYRRGDTMPKVEVSNHAINNASLRVLDIWQATREPDEGLYSWLERMTLEAVAQGAMICGTAKSSGKIHYKRMKLVVSEGAEFPVLKTIMRNAA